MRRVALGLDVGTGSTKAGLVDESGQLLAVSRAPHPLLTPGPDRSETPPAAWLAAVQAAANDVVASTPDVEVVAVGLSGQMHGVVCCGVDGSPIGDAVLWTDRRAEPWLASRRVRDDASLLAELGNPIVPGMLGPIVAARLEDEPALRGSIASVLSPKDWVRLQLTGQLATDPSDASATLLWDVTGDGWSARACEAFGVERAWLPRVRPSSAVDGELHGAGATLLGVPAGVPVATGAADTAAALLGAGVEVGDTQVSIGTGGQIASLVDVPRVDATGRTHLYRSATPASWYAMAAMQNVGVAIDWALDVLAVDRSELAALVAPADGDTGGAVFLPYLTGERTPHLDSSLTGGFVGLRPSVTRAQLVRAVFQGVACSMRDGLDALRAAGHDVEAAFLVGGGSTDGWWQQLLADVLEVPLTPLEAADASVRGAALLGWEAVGVRPPAHRPDGLPLEPRAPTAAMLDRFRTAGQA